MPSLRVDEESLAPTGREASPRSGRSRRRLLAAVDPLGPALAVAAGVVYWLHGFNGYLSRDLGLYAYAGERVADGVAPYVGVINRSGPLSHAVPGVGAVIGRLLGVDDLLAMRVLCLVLAAASVWVAYLVGRDLFRSRLVGTATAAALLTNDAFIHYASTGPREKTFMVLVLLLACWALVRHRLGWAGLFVSLATLTWQPAFFVGATAALVGLWALPAGRRLRAFGAFTVTGLAPLAVCLLFYAAIGHLRDFLDCFVLIHAQYTQQPGLDADFSVTRLQLETAYGWSLWTILIGAAALVAGALVTLAVPSRRRDPTYRLVVALAVALLAGLLWCQKAFNGFPDLFFLLPATVLGVGYVAHELRTWLPRPVVLVAGTCWLVLATAGGLDYSVDTRDDQLLTQRAEVAAAMAVLPADTTMVSIEAPQALLLTGLTNPLQHQMFTYGLEDYVDATWPGGLDGFARDVDALDPTVIAVGTLDPTWLDPVLARDYVEVGTTPGWHWWVRRSLGEDRLRELERVLA